MSLEHDLGRIASQWAFQKAVAVTLLLFFMGVGLSIFFGTQIQLAPTYYSFVYVDGWTFIEGIGLFAGALLLYLIICSTLDRLRKNRVFLVQYLLDSVAILVFVLIWFGLWYIHLAGPTSVALNPSNQISQVYLTNTTANRVLVFDARNTQFIGNISGFDQPTFVMFNQNGSAAYVTNNGNQTESIVSVQMHQIDGTIQGTYGYTPYPDLFLAYLVLFAITWAFAYVNERVFPEW